MSCVAGGSAATIERVVHRAGTGMQLWIGNKNYSSWSMRAWVLMRQAGIPFEEVKLRLDLSPGSEFRSRLPTVSPALRVPVLVDGTLAVWDTLAIAETLAERHPERRLWPADAAQRARARSLVAEMHAGFAALRTHCPMNIELTLPEVGARLLREQPEVAADLARIDAMWAEAVRASGGPMLFGDFGIADAFYAPVVMRVHGFALPLSAESAAYAARVAALPAVREWIDGALAEHDFIAEDEPYRAAP
jgi:glutathione S-transferase